VTKPQKLYESLRAGSNAVIKFRDFERLLVAFGFVHKRTVGSHRHYRHPQVPNILTINPGKDAKRYQVRELLDIVQEHGLSLPE
jgi:predicted RNA binding protein YcfA (HicA-like mRNA interferase family)